MRAVVQRVTQSRVTVEGHTVGKIELGLMVLLGVENGDTPEDANYLAEKVVGLRVFEDTDGKMNLSLADVGGGLLVVSQFTLLGDCRRGRRPSFVNAAEPDAANQLYGHFVSLAREKGIHVECGRFREHMEVSLVNDGPVTLMLDSKKLF